MPRTLGICLVALSLAALLVTTASANAVTPRPAAPKDVLHGTPIRSMFVRTPVRGAAPGQPLQVLVVLHGMGASGEEFSRDFFSQADRYGWLIVAPTIDYGDWTRPQVVAREEPVLIDAISKYLDQLPERTGVPVRRSVLLLGHSRGAQLAHRFAEFAPERVLAVAALSAGTYTLPLSSGPQGTMDFPFGVHDMADYTGSSFDSGRFGSVQFWVGVGGLDNNPADLPRQWDPYEGKTRVQRAQAFESAIQQLGVTASLHVFNNARHEVTRDMGNAACAFLGGAMLRPSPPELLLPAPSAA
jgi:pimeloyl-ACP methyl ester carboxylesterase